MPPQSSVWAGVPYNPDVMKPDSGPPPMANISMPPQNPFTSAPPMQDVRPGPSPLQPIADTAKARYTKDVWADQNPWGTANNHPGTMGKIAHVLSVAGNIAGNIFAAPEMALIPGTQLNRKMDEGQQRGIIDETAKDQAGLDTDAQNLASNKLKMANEPQQELDRHAQSSALTRHVNDEANALENPTPQFEVHDTAAGPLFVNKQTGEAQHLSLNGTPVGPKIATKTVQLEIGGRPHQVLINEADGSPIKDLGESGEKPPVINNNAASTREFQEAERGRGLLDKAEAQYRTAQQGASTLRDMVAMAAQGNKMSAQMLPLEGALEITTAQGVRRINRTEVDQFAGGGSAFDQLAGKLGKLTAGQPIPENLFPDIRKLADAQERAAYGTYKGAYDSASRRYGLKNEQALPQPGGGAPSGPPQGADVKVKGADGRMYWGNSKTKQVLGAVE